MNLLKKSNIAFFVMVAMIVLGTLVGSHNTLMGMRTEAAAVFTAGIRGDGIGIQGDLRERGSIAYNMVVIARKYLPEENGLIQAVLNAGKALDSASGIKEKAAADKKLEVAVKDLFDVLNGIALAEQDARYPQSLYTDFRSRGDTISHDPYNKEAAVFNKALSGFPAGLLGGLTGVRSLDLFE